MAGDSVTKPVMAPTEEGRRPVPSGLSSGICALSLPADPAAEKCAGRRPNRVSPPGSAGEARRPGRDRDGENLSPAPRPFQTLEEAAVVRVPVRGLPLLPR